MVTVTIYTRLLAALFLPGIWPVFCLRLIHATYPEGQKFSHELSPNFSHPIEPQICHLVMGERMTIYRTYRWTSFFRRRRFLRFWTINLTFITFAYKNQYFVVDWSHRVFTSRKVNWPAVYWWITLDSRYVAKSSATAHLWMQPISEYTVIYKTHIKKVIAKHFFFILRNKITDNNKRSEISQRPKISLDTGANKKPSMIRLIYAKPQLIFWPGPACNLL